MLDSAEAERSNKFAVAELGKRGWVDNSRVQAYGLLAILPRSFEFIILIMAC